jgi:hypothetical protein
MSKQPSYKPTDTVGEAFAGFLDAMARFLFWAGIVVTLISTAILFFQFQASVNLSGGFNEAQAAANTALFGKIMIAGVVSLFVGTTYMFWGEEVLAAIQILGSALFFFGPPFLPGAMGGAQPTLAGQAALGAIQTGGLVFGLFSICSLSVDLYLKAKERIRQGARADQLKFGKGLKEEKEINNVFMGNCWQLPFCRKFVREKCPIFHSKRTCWKEQVGCMCEESVINNAMEGRIIPKDAVAAAKMIPINNKLTSAQKFERCKSCVIYNEHQKQKYKLLLPVTIALFVGAWLLIRANLMYVVDNAIGNLDKMMGKVTFNASGNVSESINQSSIPFQEIALGCVMLIVFAYLLKVLEFLIFKAKL